MCITGADVSVRNILESTFFPAEIRPLRGGIHLAFVVARERSTTMDRESTKDVDPNDAEHQGR